MSFDLKNIYSSISSSLSDYVPYQKRNPVVEAQDGLPVDLEEEIYREPLVIAHERAKIVAREALNSIGQKLENGLNTTGQKLEDTFRSCKNLPQYKYFTIPIYKFFVNKIGPVAATGVSFLAAELLIHQFAFYVIGCLASQTIPNDWRESLKLEDSCNFSYSFRSTLMWAGFAIPVMYAKYVRSMKTIEAKLQVDENQSIKEAEAAKEEANPQVTTVDEAAKVVANTVADTSAKKETKPQEVVAEEKKSVETIKAKRARILERYKIQRENQIKIDRLIQKLTN